MRKVRCKQRGSPFVKWASIDHFTLCFVVVVVVVVIVVLVVVVVLVHSTFDRVFFFLTGINDSDGKDDNTGKP